MNKFLVGVVVIGVGAVALGAGSLAIIDGQIDKMVGQLESSVSAPMTVDVILDDSSLLARQIDMVISIQEADVNVNVFIKNEIEKRPWGTTIVHSISMDSPFTQQQESDEFTKLFEQYFVEQAFVTGTTNVSFSGHYQTILDSIAIAEKTEQGELDVKPLHMEVTGDIKGGITMAGQWPGMSVTTNDLEKVTLALSPMEFSANGEMYQNSLFLGKQRISGQGLNLSQSSDWSEMQAALGAYSVESEGRLIDERFMGRASVEIASLAFTADGESLQAKNIQTTVSIEGIAADNYQAIAAGLNEMQTTGIPSEQLMSEANVLLRNGFILEFSDWKALIDDQNIAFNAMFELPENTVADVNNPFSLMGLFASVKANANLQFDAGLSDVPQLYDAVFGLLNSGAVVNNGDAYSMTFTLENGVATLNGEPLPLPF